MGLNMHLMVKINFPKKAELLMLALRLVATMCTQ